MSRVARTVLYFGWYLVILGAWLALFPNTLLSVFGVPPTSEVWIRLLGIVAVIVGYFYIQAARHDLTAFFRLTLHSRPFAFVTFTGLVVLGLAPTPLLVFAVIELLGTAWTWRALHTA